ncbi:Lrp/AsnC family transcriptional regulator [Candidatus Woesearchaeota archaeon]|nr:Lrp/AsnC family transcriptional regulator [Nanoarchaeota archaeon]MCB9370570.1 Lrp/AsnC family transcriptional regulator [Candidatus Woesearchaeota archaeon]USN43652.1 MAG: Lrp/AsnC family transcriptional regulator [Candidatus Woesearchaeota archaeon]
MNTLDKKDLQILIALDKNARMPISQLAKKTRLTKDIVAERIKKLEEKQIITHYYTVIDYAKLGYTTYKLFLYLENTDITNTSLIKTLEKRKEVNFLAISSGEDYNLAINYNSKKIGEFKLFYEELLSNCSNGILRKKLGFVNEIQHFSIDFLLDQKKEILYSTGKETDKKETLSETEEETLRLLSQDARISYVDLSKKIKKTPNALLYTVRNLQRKKIILGYRTNISWEKLGFTHYKVYVYLALKTPEIEKRLVQGIFSLPSSIYVTKVINSQDLEFEILCKNQLEFHENLSKLKKTCPEIKEMKTKMGLKIIRINYCPF